jgi:hypothetical protein
MARTMKCGRGTVSVAGGLVRAFGARFFLREAKRLKLIPPSPNKYLLRSYPTSTFTDSEAFRLITRQLNLRKEQCERLDPITRRRKQRQAFREARCPNTGNRR